MKRQNMYLAASLTLALGALSGMTALAEEAATEAVTEAAGTAESTMLAFPIENALDYVTLFDYEGMKVEKTIYEVSDTDLASEMEMEASEHATRQATNAASKDGDTLTGTIRIDDGNSNEEMEDFSFTLGYEQFGSEFDENLTGVTEGSEHDFEITYDEETAPYQDWVDLTVRFHFTVNSIEETITPEINDEFVTNILGYDSMEAYTEEVRTRLEEQNEEYALSAARSTAIEQVMDGSEFSSIPEELYSYSESTVQASYAYMAEMFGMSMEEMMEAFGVDEDSLQEEIDSTSRRYLLLSALAAQAELTVSDEEIMEFAEATAQAYGYESADDLLAYTDYEELRWAAAEQAIGDYLLSHSNVVAVYTEYDADDLSIEDDTEDWEILEGLGDEGFDVEVDDEDFEEDEDDDFEDDEDDIVDVSLFDEEDEE
ncbi:MAG: hypothetical protein Q4B59_01920 [Lachnospiraceae bacterium]|nr:hypothetical protein [Lachnospiraceae bacterium]